ncbi:MAG TPA: hypothetical protein VMZ91_16795 [Candidatus Paceibacterota bacterium]|nr:hypothetical protein [Candidatus Paceibacterota bacterium]
MKGEVIAISQKNRSVLIGCEGEEAWYPLGEAVKLNYVKKGECEFSIENDPETGNEIVSFIKAIGGYGKDTYGKDQTKIPRSFPQKSEKQANRIDLESEMITRMSALKSSSRIFEATGKEAEFKRLTNEIVQFIETGIWTEKI